MRSLRLLKALLLANMLLMLPVSLSARDISHQTICDAIKNSQTIILWYRPGEGPRTVLPRFLGYTRAGNQILNGWQISGFSSSGNLPGHRSFRLDRITNIEFTEQQVAGPALTGNLPSAIDKPVCAVGDVTRQAKIAVAELHSLECNASLPKLLGMDKFETEAVSMPPEARQALKTIILKCSTDIEGNQCDEAIETFDLEYGDRFSVINLTAKTWHVMETSNNLQVKMNLKRPNALKDSQTRDELKSCLQNAYRAK